MSLASRGKRLVCAAATVVAFVAVPMSPASAAGVTTGVSVTRDGTGYVTVTDDGRVSTYGVHHRGNPYGFSGNIVDIAVTHDGGGYVAISSYGQVYAFGNVPYRGNVVSFPGEVADISVTADGLGYAAVTTTGHVYAFGTARYRGGVPGLGGTNPATGISLRPDGEGYVVVTARGYVHPFQVSWQGDPRGFSGDIVDIALTSHGEGYVAISSAGQVYAFNVPYRGNPTGFSGTITGVAVPPDGGGYVAVSSAGQRYAYGKIPYGGGARLGQQQNANVAAYWNFGAAGATITDVDQDFWTNDKAPTTFWALQFGWLGIPDGGYAGLQVDGNRFDGSMGETAVFSIWNATGQRGGTCGEFGGEGTGLSCRVAYRFEPGLRYRIRITREEADLTGQWWTATVRQTFPDIPTETVIGSLRSPLGGTAIGSVVNFSEYFGPSVAAPWLVPQSVVEFTAPRVNAVPFTYETYADTGAFAGAYPGSGTTSGVEEVTYGDGSHGVRVRMGG